VQKYWPNFTVLAETFTVTSLGFDAWRGTKVRENKLRVTPKYYEIRAISGDKAISQYIFFWVGNHIESNVSVCAVLK